MLLPRAFSKHFVITQMGNEDSLSIGERVVNDWHSIQASNDLEVYRRNPSMLTGVDERQRGAQGK